MGQVTRFYDRGSGQDGPVSGALVVIPVHLVSGATSTTTHNRIKMPAGMGFEITDISVSSGTIASNPSLTIGTAAAGAEIVAAVNVTTDLGALTIVDGTVDAGGFIDVRVVNDSADEFDNLSITIVGHVTSPPTTVAWRS